MKSFFFKVRPLVWVTGAGINAAAQFFLHSFSYCSNSILPLESEHFYVSNTIRSSHIHSCVAELTLCQPPIKFLLQIHTPPWVWSWTLLISKRFSWARYEQVDDKRFSPAFMLKQRGLIAVVTICHLIMKISNIFSASLIRWRGFGLIFSFVSMETARINCSSNHSSLNDENILYIQRVTN